MTDGFLDTIAKDAAASLTLLFPVVTNGREKGKFCVRGSHGESSFMFAEAKMNRESMADVTKIYRSDCRVDCIGQVRAKLTLQQETNAIAEKIGERTHAVERTKKDSNMCVSSACEVYFLPRI